MKDVIYGLILGVLIFTVVKLIKTFAICTILAGCGKGLLNDVVKKKGKPMIKHEHNSVFNTYTNELAIYGIYVDTSIYFEEREDGTAATCTQWGLGDVIVYKEIAVDPVYWEKQDEANRLQLIAHEIGHCDYGLDHVDTQMSIQGQYCPTSIMHDTNFGDPCFTDNFNHYIDEFLGVTDVLSL